MQLAIMWRNPDPKWHKQRWQTLERGLDRSLYVVQELVIKGEKGQWFTSHAFEVRRGGRKPALSPMWNLPMRMSKW